MRQTKDGQTATLQDGHMVNLWELQGEALHLLHQQDRDDEI
jgi:hypothetical protein